MARITPRVSFSCVEAKQMRWFLSRVCVTVAGLALPMGSAAQTPPPTTTQPPPTVQSKPAPEQPAETPDPAAEDTRSLFAPRWNMFQLSGRVSSVSGDPARWQRYQDLGD